MPDFLHNENLNDRERLVAFVPFVRELLDGVVQNGPVDSGLVNEVRSAWADLQGSQEFNRFEAAVMNASEGRITEHGLSGPQFSHKRAVIRRWYDRYTQQPIARVLKRLLDVVDNLLDSLVDLVGIGGAIKEFKEAVAGSLEEE